VSELLNRVIAEKRSILLPLVVAVVANLAAYALVVRPRAAKSAGAADRAAAAADALRAAENEFATAQALVEGKSRADEELNAFYQKVLPADLAAARRMTYASLPALARRTGIRYEQRRTAVEDPEKDSQLGHLTIRMVLVGEWEDIRDFIYQLESAPEFVIIDDVTLVQSDEAEQTLTIDLSTYFRMRTDGV
jgi:Tfp pilus assembly protein PilO